MFSLLNSSLLTFLYVLTLSYSVDNENNVLKLFKK